MRNSESTMRSEMGSIVAKVGEKQGEQRDGGGRSPGFG